MRKAESAAATPVSVELTYHALKIRFGGALHLRIKRDLLHSFQSWEYQGRQFFIEYHLTDGTTIMTDYDRQDHWRAILSELDRLL